MGAAVFAVLVLVIWVSLGVSTVLIFFARHGRRSLLWYGIGVVLGPMLIPIAAEMDRRGERLLRWETHDSSRFRSAPASTTTLRVLGAIDGSYESDRALRDAMPMLTRPETHVTLLTVLDPDRTGPDEQLAARDLLKSRTAWLEDLPVSVGCEVASGDPVEVILNRATTDEVDLLFLGRRGRGLSHRLLGSVATQVVTRAPGAVLLGPPAPVGIHRDDREHEEHEEQGGSTGPSRHE